MGKAGAATRAGAARQHPLEVREPQLAVERVRPADRVPDTMAMGEGEATLAPVGGLEGLDLGPRVVAIGYECRELPCVAVLRRVGQEIATRVETDRRRRLVALPARRDEEDGRRRG